MQGWPIYSTPLKLAPALHSTSALEDCMAICTSSGSCLVVIHKPIGANAAQFFKCILFLRHDLMFCLLRYGKGIGSAKIQAQGTLMAQLMRHSLHLTLNMCLRMPDGRTTNNLHWLMPVCYSPSFCHIFPHNTKSQTTILEQSPEHCCFQSRKLQGAPHHPRSAGQAGCPCTELRQDCLLHLHRRMPGK